MMRLSYNVVRSFRLFRGRLSFWDLDSFIFRIKFIYLLVDFRIEFIHEFIGKHFGHHFFQSLKMAL